jgi:hypothetical protein
MSMEEIKYTLMKSEAERLLASVAAGFLRIERLEQALFEYGEHKQGCKFRGMSPDAHCDCGLEEAINGP